jgi:DnaK suppressor protein
VTSDAIRAELATKRRELEAELAALQVPTDDAGGISFGKRVGDGTSVAVERLTQVAAYDGLRDMLDDVRRAEAKLADGTYGTCARCGRPIPVARLEARPWAPTCVDCAA